jgi:hypothetical protein
MPCLGLYGQMSLFSEVTEEMGLEVAENVTVEAVFRTSETRKGDRSSREEEGRE